MLLRFLSSFGRLFVITNGFEAGFLIYALSLGAAMRGQAYVATMPGGLGWLLYGCCMLAALMAGAAIVDGVKARRAGPPPRRLQRVRHGARLAAAADQGHRSFGRAAGGRHQNRAEAS